MSLVLQRETTEYIYFGVEGPIVTGAVELAFLAAGVRPEVADWETAIKINNDGHDLWTDASTAGLEGDWFIGILIRDFGTEGLVLAAGDYQPWIRLTDAVERPVRLAPVTLEIA
jgi:hypothetical protein